MDTFPEGHQVGAYRIRKIAGRGAVGVVYLAEHVELGKPVAIKTISPAYSREEVFRERFSREAQGAASVDHPNIISVFDVGEQDDIPYLVMTFVDGPDLERVLTDRGGKIEPAEAVLICAAIANALDAAAAKGLAHRDVKPANILLEGWEPEKYGGRRRAPHVYLTDFGLIKSSAQARVTQTGQFVGTLLYMAPEQIESRAVPASDQYSLACVLWECLTATFPFEPTGGSNLSLLTAHISHPVPAISERPGNWSRALDEVFYKALAKKPDDRFPTSKAFIDAATQALGLGTTAPPVASEPPLDAIEHTQIIPTSAPARSPRPAPASSSTSPPPGASGADRPSPSTAGPVPSTPFDPQRSSTGTPAAFPAGVGRGGPSGLPSGHMPHAAPPQSSSKKVAIGVGVLVVLIIATIIALLVFSGGDDDGATALATQAPAAAVDDQPPDATDPAALDDEALPAQDDAPDEGLAVVPAAMQGRIAFVALDDIWAATGGGADVENLTLGRVERPRQPAWRPGAEEVLVSSTGGLRLVEVGRDAPPTVVTLDDQHLDPAWDPAGEQIVFSIPVEGGGRDLAIMTLEGDAPRLLGVADALGTDGTPGNALRPAWAPDGDRIAFQAEDGSGLGIWVVPASGGPPQLVAGAPGARDFHPAWTPQGDLLFTSDRVSPLSIWLHEIATGVERRVASIREDVLDADVSPCGDWVAYQIGTDGSTRVGVHTIGGGSVEFGELPSPEGIEAMGDPSWAGQACP